MIAAPPPRDLIALVADGQMKAALEGILARHESLSIHPVACDIFVYPGHDPGVYTRSGDFLSAIVRQYERALVMLLESVLRQARVHRSASLYKQLSSAVSLNRCVDPAFVELRSVLSSCFPIAN